MRFLRKLAGDVVGSEKLWARIRAAIWQSKEPAEVIWAGSSGQRPRGRPKTHWRDYASQLAWERLRVPQKELKCVNGERGAWNHLLSLALGKWMDEWMGGWMDG